MGFSRLLPAVVGSLTLPADVYFAPSRRASASDSPGSYAIDSLYRPDVMSPHHHACMQHTIN